MRRKRSKCLVKNVEGDRGREWEESWVEYLALGCVATIEATLFELMENAIMWKMWNSQESSYTNHAKRDKKRR